MAGQFPIFLSSKVSVNTRFGPTEREEVKNIVEQGGTWGEIFCSNSMDSLERKYPKSTKCIPYRYEEIVEVPLLSYIDDINKVSKCGIEALESNAYITTQIELKRLKFNVGDESKGVNVKDFISAKITAIVFLSM